jgi:hypothetical protein
MTEKEAKELECRNVVFTDYNAGGIPLYNYCPSCEASDCAMWRWNKTERPGNKSGYCGLAGPEK